ncbi:hypothetical protein [Bradyrhizobium sp. 25ACV]
MTPTLEGRAAVARRVGARHVVITDVNPHRLALAVVLPPHVRRQL